MAYESDLSSQPERGTFFASKARERGQLAEPIVERAQRSWRRKGPLRRHRICGFEYLLLSAITCSGVASRPAEAAGFAAGGYHCVGVKTGQIVGLGDGTYGQLGPSPNDFLATVPGLTGITQVAAGGFSTIALKSDGTVWFLGETTLQHTTPHGTPNPVSRPVQVAGLSGIDALAAGHRHFLALDHDGGQLFAWGHNGSGQVGNGSFLDTGSPAPVLTGVASMAAGDGFSMAVKSDSTVWSWGRNTHGQLGLGDTVDRPIPTIVPGVPSALATAAGGHHALILLTNGSVFATGNNTFGQLGLGANGSTATPTAVAGLSGINAIAAGYHHSAALGPANQVSVWGRNFEGQCGGGDSSPVSYPSPQAVALPAPVNALACGYHFTIFELADGTIWGTGSNSDGQLDGNSLAGPSDSQKILTPQPVPLNGPRCPFGLSPSSGAAGVTLAWQNGDEMPTSIRILRDTQEIASAAAVDPPTYTDADAQPGLIDYELIFTMPGDACEPLATTFDACITDLTPAWSEAGVVLTWINNLTYDGIEIKRNGVVVETSLAGSAEIYTDTNHPPEGLLSYTVVPTNGTCGPATVRIDVGIAAQMQAVTFDSVGNTNTAEFLTGWEFSIAEPITVTYLGHVDMLNDGIERSAEVGLWSVSTGRLLDSVTVLPTSVSVASGTGSTLYEPVTSLTLSPGNYIVAAQSNGENFYFDTPPAMAAGVTWVAGKVAPVRPLPDSTAAFHITRNDTGSYFGANFVFHSGTQGLSFVRGDADADGVINITDGIFILGFLFLGGEAPTCKDAADADDSDAIDISDGVYLLNFLFLGGASPKVPWPDCGSDPDDDAAVTCETSHADCGL